MNLIAELNSEVKSNDLVVGIHLISVNNRGSLLEKCECPKQYPVLCISTVPPIPIQFVELEVILKTY